jgi:hypothetical protein
MPPTIDIRPLKDVDNTDIINAIRNDASSDYRKRVPEATQARLQDNLQHLIDYRPAWNEFVESLINRIGLVIAKNTTWQNPLAKFKRGMMNFGDTIEEIYVGLVEARTYSTDRDSLEKVLFGQHAPDTQTSFHRITRQEYYPITVNEPILKRAFIEDGGLSKFVTDVMTSPTTSDEWDEFLQTTALFNEYYRAGGFFKVQVDDVGNVDSNAAEARYLLRRLREFATNLTFMNTIYNAAGMPMAVDAIDLELFITPEALAAVDVEALAAAFQIDKADIKMRITPIPYQYFGIPGIQAILTTSDFFVIADTLIDTASQYNAATLGNNFFLHHHEIISASRFTPAILFTTEEGTPVNVDDTPVVGITTLTINDESTGTPVTVTQVIRGEIYQVLGNAITEPEGGYNNALRLAVSGNISTHTYITQDGVLHVGLDEDSTEVTVNAWAVDTDIPQLTASVSATVAGDKAELWPDPHVDIDSDEDTLFEVTPAELTMNGSTFKVKIPNVEGVQYKNTVDTGVTFTDAGDIVTIPGHEASIGDIVSFGAITGTTGVTAATEYFVLTVPTANTMTISATDGGATLVLTTNGTAASATLNVADGSTKTVPAATTRTFTAVAESGYELAAGVTTSWPFTRA